MNRSGKVDIRLIIDSIVRLLGESRINQKQQTAVQIPIQDKELNQQIATTLKALVNDQEKIQTAYSLFPSESQKLFLWILYVNITSLFIEKRNLNDIFWPSFIEIPDAIQKLIGKKRKLDGLCIDDRYIYMNNRQLPLCYETITSWIDEIYTLPGICDVYSDDIVISGGGHYGDTTVLFADKAGKNGRVYSFEPSLSSWLILRKTIADNHLADRTFAIPAGLWDREEKLYIANNNSPVSQCISRKRTEISARLISLDKFSKDNSLRKVDFIKLDIEGAEMRALTGAQHVIRSFSPRLAVCVYHRLKDIYELPLYLHALKPEYLLYLSAKTDPYSDFVVFAVPPV